MLVRMGNLSRCLHVIAPVLLGLMLAGFVKAQGAPQSTQTYTSSEHGFSIDFPADWKRVPEADVKKGENTVHASNSSASSVIWEAVFQAPGGSHSFAYPYVILQIVPYSVGRQLRESEMEQTVKQMAGENVKKFAGTTGNKAIDDALSGANFGNAQYDSANHVVYQSIDMNAPGVGMIKGLTVSHFGRNALVSVMCYDTADHVDSSRATFNRINASYRFDANSAYDPSQSSVFGNLSGGAARGAIIGAVIGVLVAAIIWFIRRGSSASR